MKARTMMLALAGVTLTVLAAGCATGSRASSIDRYYKAVTVYGKVIRAYPFRGTLIADVGSREGVHKGDLLLLMRDGKVINYVVVDNVQNGTFYGQLMDPDPSAEQAKVGDSVVRDPRLYEVKPKGTSDSQPATDS